QTTFQYRQFVFRVLAENCHLLLTSDSEVVHSVKSYFSILKSLGGKKRLSYVINGDTKKFWPDASTVSLAILFGLIVAVYVLVVETQLGGLDATRGQRLEPPGASSPMDG